MPVMKHVAPKEGMRLRIPEENYRVLPPEGADVRWNMFWAKAEQRGEIDVSDVAPAKDEGKHDEGKHKAEPKGGHKAEHKSEHKPEAPKASF